MSKKSKNNKNNKNNTPKVLSTAEKLALVVKRTENTTVFKPTLHLSDIFLDTVNHLHEKVKKDTEWSAILLYSNRTGTIDDPNKWEIDIEDCILMDIGTSAYTEYDMEADDAYATDKWMDHLEKGGKIGHLHTHHSMNCYFSGTDMGELHDNAPEHNYYLSLIVNYEDITKWCAKVAICGSETVKGSIETTTTWHGSKGIETNTKKDKVDTTEEMLYLMDCKLVSEKSTNVPEGLDKRIKEVITMNDFKKAQVTTYSHRNRRPYSPYTSPSSMVEDETDTLNYWEHDWDWDTTKQANDYSLSKEIADRPNRFAPLAIKPMLIKFLANDEDTSATLAGMLMVLEDMTPEHLDTYILKIFSTFEEAFGIHYAGKLSRLHLHAIVVSIYSLLDMYESFNCVKALDVEFMEYLLEEEFCNTTTVEQMTGLSAIQQVVLEK